MLARFIGQHPRGSIPLELGYAAILLGVALAASYALRDFVFPVPVPFFVAIALVARRGSMPITLLVLVVSTLALDFFVGSDFLKLDDPIEDIVVGGGMLLVALVVKRLDDDLRAAEAARARLADSSSQAVAAEERVRREIAELLHSRVQSRLVAAWTRLKTIDGLVERDPARARSLIASISDELEDIREREIRQASYLLHPSFIREGLGAAVDALAERYERELAVTVTVSPAFAALDTPVRNAIPEPLRLAAFRVVEEALGNVLRHAQARSVSIDIGLDERGNLCVEIRDDGRGFDMSRMRAGLGIASIESRVSQTGGSWAIQSADGNGTTVSVSLPLRTE